MIKPFVPVLLRQWALLLLLVPISARVCLGATLHERSAAQLKVAEQTASPADYSFVVLGDSRAGDQVFKKALKMARSFRPLFILHGGDYSERGGEEETRRFLSLVSWSVPDIPLFVVRGNHEKNQELFARLIGPLNFTVASERLGLTLVAVDNSENVLKATELAYLRSQLSAAAGTRFVAMHVPPQTERWNRHTFSQGANDLKRILAKERVQGAFFFHVHSYDRSEFGGVPAFISGGAGAQLSSLGFPGESVHHILVVRLTNGKASFTKVLIPR